jgi:hypothetical protein
MRFLRSRIYVRQHFTAVCLNFSRLASSQATQKACKASNKHPRQKVGLENICFDFFEAMVFTVEALCKDTAVFSTAGVGMKIAAAPDSTAGQQR